MAEKTRRNTDIIISRQQLIFRKTEHDITGELIETTNAMTPQFPDLPKVNINKNKSYRQNGAFSGELTKGKPILLLILLFTYIKKLRILF